MVRNAEDMMLDSEVAPFTNLLLGQISKLDQAGAWTWDLRFVSFLWFMGFWAVRLTFGKRGGVDWYALTHAIVTGVGGSVCAYLSFVSAEQMTGIPGRWPRFADEFYILLLPLIQKDSKI